MKARLRALGVVAAAILVGLAGASFADEGNSLADKIGLSKGICVLLGDEGGEQAIELAGRTELLIYLQYPNDKQVDAARRAAAKAGLLGTRIFIDKGALSELHLADNVADVVVAPRRQRGMSRQELMRVLRPGGKALTAQRTAVKPAPEGLDDWSHPYHGPDNNPQSNDKVVVAPYLTQFLAEPRYGPLPQVAVASAGRLFKAFGHVAFKEREEPLLNTLVCFNGYNGTILWKRDLTEGVMIHRNTMIATPDVLYVGDDKSCKRIDTTTGKLIDEIIPPTDVAGGTFWKWMALEDGVLYALIGEREQRDPTKRWRRDKHGWPWDPVSEGFNQPTHPWGYGRNVLAIDPKTKNVLWDYHEDEPIDSRAMCMKNGRIYIFRFGEYLACLNAKNGEPIWRRTPDNAAELFEALGEYLNRQDWRTNWRTTCYLKCSDKALYFAGPQVGKLLAVSTQDGCVMWENAYSNFQLVLREDGLYGLSGQIDKHPSKKFDPLTGEELAEINIARRACSRPSGSADAVFFRAEGGSVRVDTASNRPNWISPMRAQCHDGVTIANGLLYWWPSVCDCQLTLYGVTSLGPAGDFDFTPEVDMDGRLQKGGGKAGVAELPVTAADWSSFRADNVGSATTPAVVPGRTTRLWKYEHKGNVLESATLPTAPTTAGDLVFIARPCGAVQALDATNGRQRWIAYTGGPVRIAPTLWRGRAYVGSGDGWVYAFEAKTGRLLWRFRAAPAERKIPVYGQLVSTWPAASGVLVEDGTAYVAAGIVNYDGTYVYALDAETGQVKWQNNDSGHLDKAAQCGVSVQGHMLLHEGRLYLAGGTSVSPAAYDIKTGKCFNDGSQLAQCVSHAPRGWELFVLADQVVACGKPYYAHPAHGVFDGTVFSKVHMASGRGRDVVWACNEGRQAVLCYDKVDKTQLAEKLADGRNRFVVDWARLAPKEKPAWRYDCGGSVAVALAKNAVVIATESKVCALELDAGETSWSHPLETSPVPWGLAVDRDGRVVLTLRNGDVLCFAQESI